MLRFRVNHHRPLTIVVNGIAIVVGAIVLVLLFSNSGILSKHHSSGTDGGATSPPYFPDQVSNNKKDSSKDILRDEQESQNTETSLEGNTLSTNASTQCLVMNIEYPGQQGSGAMCLSTLQCFLSSIYHDFKIVEPYFHSSHFTNKKSSLKFSSVFNIDWFTSQSQRAHYPGMMPIEEFERLEDMGSPIHHKYIIFVHLNLNPGHSKLKFVWTQEYSPEHSKVRCLTPDLPEYSQINKNYLKLLKVARSNLGTIMSRRCMVRMLEMDYTVTTIKPNQEFTIKPVDSVFKLIFDNWPPGDVLLVFSKWPKTFIPVDKPVSGIHCLQEYRKTKMVYREQFEPSQRLLNAAKKYEQLFLDGGNHLAIMFRVERAVTGYLREAANRGKTIEDCFGQVVTLKAKMDDSFTKVSTPFITLDIGAKYGTDSFRINDNIVNLTTQVIKDLYENKLWSISEWEESFARVTEGERDAGYMAALQRLLASRADCMILLGGGDFQAFAVTDYLQFHKNTHKRCVKVVCSISEKNNEVQNTLDQLSTFQ